MAGDLVINKINSKDISSSLVATESQVICVGQTWQDVTGSRVAGTTYTNSTGKPITVLIFCSGTSKAVYVNGTVVGTANATVSMPFTIIVPNSITYSIDAGTTITKWAELR